MGRGGFRPNAGRPLGSGAGERYGWTGAMRRLADGDPRDRLIPADMRCPTCGKVKAGRRRWAVDLKAGIARCLSCAMKEPSVEKKVRVLIRGEELRTARERAYLQQKYVAAQCGWSRTYQCKLEQAEETYVPEGTALKLLAVLPRYDALRDALGY